MAVLIFSHFPPDSHQSHNVVYWKTAGKTCIIYLTAVKVKAHSERLHHRQTNISLAAAATLNAQALNLHGYLIRYLRVKTYILCYITVSY